MPLYIALLAYPTALGATLSVDPTGSGDYTRLGAALSAASSGDTIQIAAGSYTGPFDTNGKNLTIAGAGVSSTILTAGSSQTVLTIDDGETVTVSGLTLYSALQGVEVRGSTARLSGVHVTDHSGRTPGSGAGVYDGGTLTVTGCVFARNEASSTYSGGGIYVSESTLTVSNSTFRDNSAGQGGALYLDDSAVTLTDVNLLRNTATSHGGAIRMRYGADVDTTRLSATDNTAGGRGGAISSYQADLSIADGVFTGNEAGTSGGALHLDQTSSASVRVTAEITGNTATTTGGGIYADNITLDLTGTLSDNTAGATSDGGGIYAITADVTLDNVEVARNRAGSGGGIFSFYGGRLYLSNIALEDNEAELEGGGIYTRDALSLTGSTVTANVASSNGGGIAAIGTAADVTDTVFQDNTSGDAGGCIYLNDTNISFGGEVSLTGCQAVFGGGLAVAGNGAQTVDFSGGQIIADNSASAEGGGMFLSNLASAVLDGVELSRNTGGVAGGGARLADLATMSAIDLLVQGNTADQGAGLHLSGMGVGETAYSRFLGNIATNAGGGILAQNPGAQHPMHHLQFAENQATEGAGLYLFNDTSTQHPLTFSDFVANDGPAVSLRQSPGALVSHTSAAHNSGDGFEADTASATTARIEWSCSWDNATEFGGALSSLVGTDGNISADPDYATVTRDGDPTNDRLIPGSRSGLRDMGDPSLSDLDGTTADLGHLGGPDAWDQDQDGDGSAISDGDCDDAEPTTLPGASEVWYDGEDSDCLGGDDFDADLDGYPIPDDCDDQDAAVNPAALDDTTDGVDQDCDGKDGPEDGTGSSTPDASPDARDLDGDGFTEADDCDDADSRAYPGNTETCGDRVDNDCDGYIDDFDSECVGKASARACSALAASGALPGAALALLLVAARRR